MEIPLSFKKKGLYYVQTYLSDTDELGRCRSRSCWYSAEGKIQASGLVIRIGEVTSQSRENGPFGFGFFP